MPLTLDEVWPANGARNVELDCLVEAILHNSDSTAYTKLETTQADFAAGTLVNATARATDDLVLAAAVGGALSFSGSAQALQGARPSSYNFTSNITIEAWVKPGATMQYGGILSSGTANTSTVYFELYMTPSGGLTFWFYSGAGRTNACTVNPLTAGAWYHVAVTYDGAHVTFYVNGVQAGAQVAQTNVLVPPSGGTVRIGNTEETGDNYFKGVIDDVRLWNVVRTQADIAAFKDQELVGNESGLIGYWKLDEGTGTTVADSSSTGVTLNFFGSPTWVAGNVSPGAAAYQPSGSRVSPAYPLSTVGKFGTGIVEYDSTLPANTTLTLKISKDGTNWTTVASGDRIALWAEGDDLSAASIYTKAELATTDTGQTPVLSEVRLKFLPFDPSQIELNVDGHAFTTANGLALWNESYSRAVLRSVAGAALWWNDGLRESGVTILVKYKGAALSTTSARVAMEEAIAAPTDGYWAALRGSPDMRPGVADGFWCLLDITQSLLASSVNGFYYVASFTPTEADGYYWVAHPFYHDTPEVAVVGQPHLADLPEGVTIKGYNPKDFAETVIVQGWMRNDQPEHIIVGNPFTKDFGPDAVIVAREQLADLPEGAVVYAVNRYNGMSIRIMSVEEAALLADLGVLVVD